MRTYAIGYSTCGFAAGRSMVALIEKLAEAGYDGVELELDRERFHPHFQAADLVRDVRRALERTGIRAAIGTGGRYVLTDTRHHPGAVSRESADRARWCGFVEDAVDMAGEVGANVVMIHSGYAPAETPQALAWSWLTESMDRLAQHAARRNKILALEWHPEMFLRTKADYLRARHEIGSQALACTLDVGHAHCTEDEPLDEVIRELAPFTAHVQLEDMKNRVHKHLRLGEGEIDFPSVFSAFAETKFSGVIALEFNAGDLGGNGDELAETSIRFLREKLGALV
jgi:sugar phosphate isomerase/epimerase